MTSYLVGVHSYVNLSFSFPVDDITIIKSGLNSTLPVNTTHYLRSPNFGVNQDDSRDDVTTSCVIRATSNDTFNACEFRANIFTHTAGSSTGQLDVNGTLETGESVTYQLQSHSGLRHSNNHTDLLHEPLQSLDFTYRKGEENMSFLLTLQGLYSLRICARHFLLMYCTFMYLQWNTLIRHKHRPQLHPIPVTSWSVKL